MNGNWARFAATIPLAAMLLAAGGFWFCLQSPASGQIQPAPPKADIPGAKLAGLEMKLDVDFDEVPLADAIRWFSEKTGVPMSLDEKALQEASLAPNDPMSLKLSGVSA